MGALSSLRASLGTDRRWKLFGIVGLLSLVADQATKIYARSALPTTPRGDGIPLSVIENYWDWQLSENPGASFGIFGSNPEIARIFLSVVGVAACGLIVWMVYKSKDEFRRLNLAFGLIIGGAIGNLVDRIAFGVVTDFIVWRYHEHRWPTFNIADVALVVGVLFIFLDIGKLEDRTVDKEDAKRKSKKKKRGKKKRAT